MLRVGERGHFAVGQGRKDFQGNALQVQLLGKDASRTENTFLYPLPAMKGPQEPVKSSVGNGRRTEAQLGQEHPESSCNTHQSLALMKEGS